VNLWRRLRRLAAVLLAPLLVAPAPACVDISDLANFIDSPFARLSARVTNLNGAELDGVMSELMLRFRSYLELRRIIPIGGLTVERCLSQTSGSADRFSFVADVNCVFGDNHSPAEGAIAVTQRQVADTPPVLELDLDYRAVRVGELEVHGAEHIHETVADDGASIRTLDLEQDGFRFDYEFRFGFLGGETPVFDYELPLRDGHVLARVTNPRVVGAYVTVFLTGLDGMLECEVRDAAWAPGEAARGTCCPVEDLADDGSCPSRVTFGLPRSDL